MYPHRRSIRDDRFRPHRVKLKLGEGIIQTHGGDTTTEALPPSIRRADQISQLPLIIAVQIDVPDEYAIQFRSQPDQPFGRMLQLTLPEVAH